MTPESPETARALVMLGYFGFGNAGDEAVLAAEVAALRSTLGSSTRFTVVSGDVEHTRRVHDLPAVSRTDFRAIVRALRSSDGLVAGGGSLLQDVTSARPVAFYGGVMLVARLLGKPVFVYAQGLGPLQHRVNRLLAARALRASSYVSLRDPDSIALARSLGVQDLVLVPDPVLGLPVGDAPSERARSADAVAVALRPWRGQDTWLPPVVSALGRLAEDFRIVLVPFHAEQDTDLARHVAEELGGRATIVAPDGGYRAAVDAIASSRVVLGMRLHALVSAVAAGVPFVALSYDPKVDAFAARCDRPVAATVPGSRIDPEVLEKVVREAVDRPLAPGLAEGADAPARAIATLLR
ncbi:MAG TPA: polysaccharide pyruvyl transferase CsaB [Actinopolymorphaceae bacterium]